jgi:hypothetical protein
MVHSLNDPCPLHLWDKKAGQPVGCRIVQVARGTTTQSSLLET